MAITPDAALVADRLRERLAEHDADILGRVMEVDVQVALGADVEVEQRVAGERGQHVVEEADPGGRPARCPVPSRSSRSVIWVSEVLRVISAVRAMALT